MFKIVSPKKGSNAALIMWLMVVIIVCTLILMLMGIKISNDITKQLNKLEVMIEAIDAENNVEQDAIIESADTGVNAIAAMVDKFTVDHPPAPINIEPEPVVVPDFSYLRDDIALSHEHQVLLHNACEEFDIPFELALAVIWRETGYVNQSVNDEYFGYMMLAKKWVGPEMEKLGVTDLMDPEGNFRIGCCLLRQFIDSKGSVEAALCRYSNDYSGWYANDVLTYMNALTA